MDDHYNQVMKAREKAGTDSRLYFAYSTVLDPTAFATWKDQHGYDFFTLPEGKLGEAVDTALVFDFPSRFWGGRVAGLSAAPGSTVWGRVFEIAGKDWPIVAHKEGGVTGMAVEVPVKLSQRVRPGVVSIPWGWWSIHHAAGSVANSLTNDAQTDWGGGVAYYDTMVAITITP